MPTEKWPGQFCAVRLSRFKASPFHFGRSFREKFVMRNCICLPVGVERIGAYYSNCWSWAMCGLVSRWTKSLEYYERFPLSLLISVSTISIKNRRYIFLNNLFCIGSVFVIFLMMMVVAFRCFHLNTADHNCLHQR